MFVKKLVEIASLKKPGGASDGLKSEDVNPRVVFHYGVPSGSVLFAYDSIQKILAISTKDGRIKLFGNGHSQTLLESPESLPSKFMQFSENQGILLNVNINNHIEVWDVDRKLLSYVHIVKEEITSFMVIPRTDYMYIGDSVGNISILKLDKEPCNILQMKYRIPFSAAHGNSTEVVNDTAVMHILPQPTAESKRVLIIYNDGFITLWTLQDSKAIFTTGGSVLQAVNHETRKVTAACWACPFGSRVVVGYSTGDIFIWSVPSRSSFDTELDLGTTQNAPIHKLNLGYKLDKIPIASLKWIHADGKANRLYVMGSSNFLSENLLQVVLINDHIESRTTKLGLHPPEPCVDMAIISGSVEQNKHKLDSLLLLGKSGHVYVYDDCVIEKYLLQSQSRSPPSLPKQIMVTLPFPDSSISTAKFITDSQHLLGSADEDYVLLAKYVPMPFSFETKQKDGACSKVANFSRFSEFKNLYITGHSNGAINFWDLSCPLFIPILSLTQQSEDDASLSGVPVTALFFDINSRLLISGDQSGMVKIFKFKSEPFLAESSFLSLQGSSKKGNNHIIRSIQFVKVTGCVLFISTSHDLKHLAVGSDKGFVSVIDLEGPTKLYEKHIASEISAAVISLQFVSCSVHGFEKHVLVVATKDSSVLAVESDTGNTLSSAMVRPKKPSKALFMQILDGHDTSGRGSIMPDGIDLSKGNYVDDGTKQLILICSEKAVYIYSLVHVVQGVKKVYYKKKFQSSSCCWASTMSTPECDAAVILLFTSGKIQIRSLPELNLIKETSTRGLLMASTSKSNSNSDSSICSSPSGEIVMVNNNQEIYFLSVLARKEIYRHLDSISQLYIKDLVAPGLNAEAVIHKEKKKGIFGSVLKDMKGSKTKLETEEDAEDAKKCVEELSMIFAVANFPLDAEIKEPHMGDADGEVDLLDIDDIDLEDPGDKPKGKSMMSALNTQKLTSKFQVLKGNFAGKLKQIKGKNEKVTVKEDARDEKTETVDQIKKKYGYASTAETSAAKLAQNKLNENTRKLQGISLKTTEMQDTAVSFSSMAKEVLRSAEHDRRSS